ncbi:MAG: aminoglycoside 6-adenylyltransferase, partial [Chloroflexota bacterium]
MNNQLEHVSAPFQALLQRIHNWIKDDNNVLLCAILGSQSTAKSSRDEWSDIDLVLIVSDTSEFDTQGKWIERLTPYDFIYQDSAEIGEGLLWHVVMNQRYMLD